jgi:hypothetical protein
VLLIPESVKLIEGKETVLVLVRDRASIINVIPALLFRVHSKPSKWAVMMGLLAFHHDGSRSNWGPPVQVR